MNNIKVRDRSIERHLLNRAIQEKSYIVFVKNETLVRGSFRNPDINNQTCDRLYEEFKKVEKLFPGVKVSLACYLNNNKN